MISIFIQGFKIIMTKINMMFYELIINIFLLNFINWLYIYQKNKKKKLSFLNIY